MHAKGTSFYVRRWTASRDGWTGPIRSRNQADREASAWIDAGWDAIVVYSDPETRRRVRDWQRAADIRHGRIPRRGVR